MACQPFFCVKSADNCNSSSWSFSVFNLTGDYDKKLKELVQEESTDVVDYAIKVESELKKPLNILFSQKRHKHHLSRAHCVAMEMSPWIYHGTL